VAVWGVPRRNPEHLDDLLSRCQRLPAWARARGLQLTGIPEDLGLLDQAIGHAAIEGLAPLAAEAGLFLGTVIIAGVPGARWQLWPNGHPVVRLPAGRDVDVVAVAGDRVS
jgi:hypothetical protein